jgi:hypothetical protein
MRFVAASRRVYAGGKQPCRSQNRECRFHLRVLVIGLASAVILATTLGCGNPPSTGKPAGPVPSGQDENKAPRPPRPDPG